MSYAQSNYGPGAISTLQSGIGLTHGPTIGSTDPGAAISMGGLGVLRTSAQARQMAPTSTLLTGLTKVTPVVSFAMPSGLPNTGLVDTNYVETDPAVDPGAADQIVAPSSGVPTWVWIVGGLAGLGLIGGLAWWALK